MTYATTEDMTSRFGEQDLILLTRRQNSPIGQIDLTVLGQALDDATSEINTYLSGRYQLPLSTQPKSLTRICCDLSRYFLSGNNAPEHIETRYKDAVSFLRAVNKGDISLGLDTTGNKAEQNDVAIIESAGSVFARDKATGFL
ncbi:gp436 family protein [Pseudoalteromonas obscura]|uniref:DUF1320 family protein n=1 Tax=Pseudoalteromonas obscura TaxID=3048491 RepID=A0ABT7EUC3_9GAMM|nr:phage protein Gp36 family protein [Pseudoalteromonas sp. P94(2023)]MDK2598660.1 DUF1320 family protein [Pseudoalteromonas sp. P94(2023)]